VRTTILVRLALAAALALTPRLALACPVCFGQNDSPMASAAKVSIIVMLLITGGVLAAFAAFFLNLMRRARMTADESRANPQEGTAQC
jgi:hypothetical protein